MVNGKGVVEVALIENSKKVDIEFTSGKYQASKAKKSLFQRLTTKCCCCSDPPSEPEDKLIFLEEDFQELFVDLHASGLWQDGKDISDAITYEAPEDILAQYRSEKDSAGFNLIEFFEAHFFKAPDREVDYVSDTTKPVEEHIEKLWPILSREPSEETEYYSTLVPLPYSYVVPGGRFNEIYYWDSYFTMLGLVESGKIDLIEGTVKNFAYMIDMFGFVPNGNRSYYNTRSQPPFFSMMVKILADVKGSSSVLQFLPAMKKEHDFWMAGKEGLSATKTAAKRVVQMPGGGILNRYFSESVKPRAEMYQADVQLTTESEQPAEELLLNVRGACESGWDFSSRWFDTPTDLGTIKTTEIVPIDLNCLLYHLEKMIALGYTLDNDAANSAVFTELAAARAQAINEHLWSDELSFYVDYNHVKQQKNDRLTVAAVFPLAMEIASSAQADQVAATLEANLLKAGGLVTTTFETGQQWDAPNGWAPHQWMGIWGLRNYNHTSLANTIKQRWIELNVRVFQNTGKLMEKYNVVDTSLVSGGGEYPVQDGFGWTNGVLLKLLKE